MKNNMDYANLHNQQHGQLQEQANMMGQTTSSFQNILASSSGDYSWNPSIRILNDGTDLYSSETIPRQFPFHATNNFITSQDYLRSFSFDNQARSLVNCENIKDETSDSFSKLRINLPFQANKPYNLLSSLHKQLDNVDHTIEPMHNSNNNIVAHQDDNPSFTSFGHFFTSTTRGSGSSSPSYFTASHQELGFNKSQALDLLSSPRTQSCSPSTQNSSSTGFYRECNMSLGHEMHDSITSPSSISNSMSGLFNEVTTTRTKRRSQSNLSAESKDQSHNNGEAKKSKSTSRSSNPPLKVRKEKLGDRISALHRLVAPFGKTDTASVLTEAIGYIQFLHDQVQTLSMPYMKSLQSKTSWKTQQVCSFGKDAETEVKILNLKSRGLCLVPVSCASYLNGFD